MARPREYFVSFSNVSISAVQDIFSLLCASDTPIEIHYVKLFQKTQQTISGLRLRHRRLPATVTQGSGGSVPTPVRLLPGDAASVVTAHVNDTVQATSSGTVVEFYDGWDLPFGFIWQPPEADRIVIKPSQAYILSLDDAPLSTIVASGHVAFGELT